MTFKPASCDANPRMLVPGAAHIRGMAAAILVYLVVVFRRRECDAQAGYADTANESHYPLWTLSCAPVPMQLSHRIAFTKVFVA